MVPNVQTPSFTYILNACTVLQHSIFIGRSRILKKVEGAHKEKGGGAFMAFHEKLKMKYFIGVGVRVEGTPCAPWIYL